MPFRPEKPKGSSSNYLGVRPVFLVSVEDVKDERFDVFLRVELMQQNSQYTDKMVIIGDFNKDSEGNITGTSSVCKKIFRFLDALGEEGGIDKKGNWVDKDDKSIENFGDYLTAKYSGGTASYPYLVYIYKKRAKDGNIYNNVYPAMFKNTEEGRKDLDGFIKFLKTNGVLVEANEAETSPKPANFPYKNQF